MDDPDRLLMVPEKDEFLLAILSRNSAAKRLFLVSRRLATNNSLVPTSRKLQTAHPANPGLHSVATGVLRLRPPHWFIAGKDPLNGGSASEIADLSQP